MVKIKYIFMSMILFTVISTANAGWLNDLFSKPPKIAHNGTVKIEDGKDIGLNAAKELNKSTKELSQSVEKLIPLAADETKQVLEKLQQVLTVLRKDLSEVYDDKLNSTVNKLDQFSTKKIKEVNVLVNETNELLKSDITLIGKESRKTIESLTLAIDKLLIGWGETSVYIIDRLVYNIIILIALVMLGVGLLMLFKMFFKIGMPKGSEKYIIFPSIMIYLILFSSVLFSPDLRVYIMKYTGVGLIERVSKFPLPSEPLPSEPLPSEPLPSEPPSTDNSFPAVLIPILFLLD